MPKKGQVVSQNRNIMTRSVLLTMRVSRYNNILRTNNESEDEDSNSDLKILIRENLAKKQGKNQ